MHIQLWSHLSVYKQVEVQKTIDELKQEVDRRDQDIKLLQKNLKGAENVLVRLGW